jgi:hypothetical protein
MHALRDLAQPVLQFRGPAQTEVAHLTEEDGKQLGRLVVGKVDDVGGGGSAAQAGVGAEELLHLVGVAGNDQYESAAVVLHTAEQCVDGFLSEAAAALVTEPVRLVDEQHSVQGPVHGLVGPDRGLAHHAGDQVGDLGLHKMPSAQQAEVAVDLADQARDCGLAGAGVAGEHQMR